MYLKNQRKLFQMQYYLILILIPRSKLSHF